jgi:hypothetical protein
VDSRWRANGGNGCDTPDRKHTGGPH